MNDSYQLLSAPHSEIALAELAEAGTLGIEEREDELVAWFPPDADLAGLADRLGGRVERKVAEDWSEKWRERIGPIRVGPIVVVPPWLAERATPEERIVIDPAMAFGTGDHATTRGCLAALVRAVTPGSRVLDFGCGSGILAIAALKLGAARALAIDCDPKAVELAAGNAAVNGLAVDAEGGGKDARLVVRVGEEPPESVDGGEFEVVVANIQSSVLFPFLSRLQSIVVPGGWLVLSGLLAEETVPLEGLAARFVEEGWQTVAWRSPGA